MSSFLITGAGLVGSWVARELHDLGHQVTLFDVAPQPEALRHWAPSDLIPVIRGDLQSIPELLSALQIANAETILHTASFLTAGVRERPYAGVQVNLMGTVNVLEAARLAGVGRVVFCSSGSVYSGMPGGWKPGADEDFPLRAVSGRPKNLYAVCKLASEQIGFTYHDLYGYDFVALRFGGVYGPWQGAMSGLPGRFVKKVVEPMIQGKPGEFDQAGAPGVASGMARPLLNLAYCRDCSHGVVRAALAEGDVTGSYDIMSGEVSVPDFVDTVRRVLPGIEIHGLPEDAPGRGESPAAQLTAAGQKLGFTPQFPLETALRDYVYWASKWLR